MTAVGSHVGCRLWGAQTRVGLVPRHLLLPTSDTLVPEHGFQETHSTEHLPRGIHVLPF